MRGNGKAPCWRSAPRAVARTGGFALAPCFMQATVRPWHRRRTGARRRCAGPPPPAISYSRPTANGMQAGRSAAPFAPLISRRKRSQHEPSTWRDGGLHAREGQGTDGSGLRPAGTGAVGRLDTARVRREKRRHNGLRARQTLVELTGSSAAETKSGPGKGCDKAVRKRDSWWGAAPSRQDWRLVVMSGPRSSGKTALACGPAERSTRRFVSSRSKQCTGASTPGDRQRSYSGGSGGARAQSPDSTGRTGGAASSRALRQWPTRPIAGRSASAGKARSGGGEGPGSGSGALARDPRRQPGGPAVSSRQSSGTSSRKMGRAPRQPAAESGIRRAATPS